MLIVNFNPFPLLLTKRLMLRQISKEDAAEMLFLRSDKRIMKFLDRPPLKSIEEAIQFIQKGEEAILNNDGIAWGIALKNDPKLIGTIAYWRIMKEHYRAEIGYLLHPDFQGKGIMHEALTTILNYGFKVMKLHSVEANVNPHNTDSIKLLERNNFIREAYHKENYYYNGKFLDSEIYSLLTPVV